MTSSSMRFLKSNFSNSKCGTAQIRLLLFVFYSCCNRYVAFVELIHLNDLLDDVTFPLSTNQKPRKNLHTDGRRTDDRRTTDGRRTDRKVTYRARLPSLKTLFTRKFESFMYCPFVFSKMSILRKFLAWFNASEFDFLMFSLFVYHNTYLWWKFCTTLFVEEFNSFTARHPPVDFTWDNQQIVAIYVVYS